MTGASGGLSRLAPWSIEHIPRLLQHPNFVVILALEIPELSNKETLARPLCDGILWPAMIVGETSRSIP